MQCFPVAPHATPLPHASGMTRQQARDALKALDGLPARNWRERQRKARTAERLRRIAYKPKPEPLFDLPF